ncbi:hypothetical protein IMX26_08560 [Clostridium sp. 'deep sea']|uniref:stalk domain-containing protein n=1 Tax=Clostridium sp. 'deep sea' TaxID=2779445 RepID=UPI0018969D1C|nr:stalk domain-containing protein [Clostridium sp. 'deep sea']QOR36844.1 hypothetical protein IMX26_08560 [Clostridium sp. 'deep sea']
MNKNKYKRIISVALMLLVIVAFMPQTTLQASATSVWDGTIATSFEGGSGIESDPYQIATASQLAYLAQLVNSGELDATNNSEKYASLNYLLTSDIDLTGTEWIVIGISDVNSFNGTFNGDCKLISNLTIGSAQSPNTNHNYAGLFGYINNATIKNIGLNNIYVNTSISGHNIAGGLVAWSVGGNITNCYTTGSITAAAAVNCYNAVGGLVGYALANTSILNSYSLVNSHAIQAAGGSQPGYIGGLTGIIQSGSTLTNCYAAGSVSCNTAYCFSGFVGKIWPSDNSKVINSYWNGEFKRIDHLGYGKDDTIFISPTEMKNSVSLIKNLNDNVKSLSNALLKKWKFVSGSNDGYPMLNGIGNEVSNNIAPMRFSACITGDRLAGRTLTATYLYYDVEGDIEEDVLVYKWYRATDSSGNNATEIIDANEKTYLLTNNDVDFYIYFEVNSSEKTLKSSCSPKILSADNWDGSIATAFAGGEGTENKPYQISSANELAYLANLVNSGAKDSKNEAYANMHYELIDNIKIGDFCDFTPIGNSDINSFKGTLKGNGNHIVNLTIGTSITPNLSLSALGLFGYLSGATIENIGLKDIVICSAKDEVVVGGLAAHAKNSTNITNCYATGVASRKEATAKWNTVGGLVGATSENVTIKDSYASVDVSCKGDAAVVGGLVGSTANNTIITNCYAFGNVASEGTVLNYSAGLIGAIFSNTTVKNSFASGDITCTKAITYGGGLIGFIEKDSLVINCYALGNITNGGGNKNYLGGVAGWIKTNITVNNCYATGDITNGNDTALVGGVVGRNDLSTIENCYFNIDALQKIGGIEREVSNKKGIGTGGDGITKILAENMKKDSFVEGLNSNAFSWMVDNNDLSLELWKFVTDENGDYPMLNGVDNIKSISNTKPYVGKVAIDGVAHVGEKLTGTYNYLDLEGDVVDRSYLWYRSSNKSGTDMVVIPNATDKEYTLTDDDIGKYVSFEVTPISNGDMGTAVKSAFTLKVLGCDVWNQTISTEFAGGDGSESNPYQIASASQLAYLAQLINNSTTNSTYADKHYLLINNIKLGYKEWTPIGTGANSFKGKFNGGNKVVSYMTIGVPTNLNSNQPVCGLFGCLNNAVIENVTVENVLINSTKNGVVIGGISAHAKDGSVITSCYVNGLAKCDAEGSNYNVVGGLIGYANNNVLVKNSYASASLTCNGSKTYSGALIGVSQNNTRVVNCYALGSVTGNGLTHNYLGGLVGYVLSSTTINNCYTTVDIIGVRNNTASVGGIIGYNHGGTVVNCYYNNEAVQNVGSVIRTDENRKGVGTGADNTTKKTSASMKQISFVDLLNQNALNWIKANDAELLKLWRFVSNKNNNYPMINGLNNTKIEINTKPFVTSVFIDGLKQTDKILLGHYNYHDLNNDAEQGSTYQWYRANDSSGTNEVKIAGATAIAYKLTDIDVGKYLKFEVIPAANNGDVGDAVNSVYTQQVCTPKTYTALKDKNAGDIVKFGGKEWILLDPAKGMIILASEDSSKQWHNKYLDKNNYANSTIRAYLNGEFINSLGEKNQNVIQVKTWDCTRASYKDYTYNGKITYENQKRHVTDKVGLLTISDCEKYKSHIALEDTRPYEWQYYWWLITAASDADYWAFVAKKDGTPFCINDTVVDDYYNVRPVIYLEPCLVLDEENKVDTNAFYSPMGILKSPTKNTKPTWSWESRSNRGSGIYRYKLNNNAWEYTYKITIFPVPKLEVLSPEYTPSTDLPEGTHTLYVQEAGLDYFFNPLNSKFEASWSGLGVIKLTIDKTLPVVDTNLNSESTNNVSKQFTVTATDNLDNTPTITVKLGKNIITPNGGGIYSVNLALGTNTITITAEDDAGNIATEVKTIDRTPDFTMFAGGNGTEFDPYQIATAEQLMYFAELVNNCNATCASLHYELTNDIDLLNKEWIPIGLHAGNSFKGSFNGNGKVVSNLKIGSKQTPISFLNAGLFGYADGAIINNVGVDNIAIYANCTTSHLHVGGLVGFLEDVKIANCYATGLIEGISSKASHYSVLGGLIGFATANNSINNSYAIVNVTGSGENNYSGGFAGISYANSKISNCYSVGSVVSTSTLLSNAGGFIGSVGTNENNTLNCYWNSPSTANGVGNGNSNTTEMSINEMKNASFALTLTKNALGLMNADKTLELSEWSSLVNLNQGLPIQNGIGNAIINKAPIVKNGEKIQSGYATPALNNKEAVPYTANMVNWFEEFNNDKLTYSVVSALDESLNISSDVDINGSALSYTPKAEQVSKLVKIVIKANDGLTDSIDNVEINISVCSEPIINAQTPVITNNLTNKVAQVGDVISLNATATVSDGGAVTYKWYKVDDVNKTNPQALPETTAIYTLNTSVAETSYYYCEVTNTNNSVNGKKVVKVDSKVVKVIITTTTPIINAQTPVITNNLTNKVAQVGDVIVLNATSKVDDGGTVTYKWYKADDVNKTNPQALSATKAAYTVNTNSAGTSYYYCEVTNTNNNVNGNRVVKVNSKVAKVIITTPLVQSSENDIISFTVNKQVAEATINKGAHTVNVEVTIGTDLTSLVPIIYVSSRATVVPASGVAQDFSNAVIYTVTAEDGTSQEWKVTVTEESLVQSSENDIISFSLNEQTAVATINKVNNTVKVEVVNGTDLTSLVPTIAVSAKATVIPASEVALDFSNAVTYTVTAEDGTSQDWVVSVTETSLIDTTPPTITTNLTSGTTYASSKIFTAIATDNLDKNPVVTVKIGNTNIVANKNGTYTANLNMGLNIITIIAKDNAGYTATETREIIREREPKQPDNDDEKDVNYDYIINNEEQNQKLTKQKTEQGEIVTVDITIKQSVLLGSVRAAKKEQKPVLVDIANKETTEETKEVKKLRLTFYQVKQVAAVGLNIKDAQGDFIELPKALLQSLSAAKQNLSLEISEVSATKAQKYLNEKDTVYAVKEINTNFSGKTKLKFRAPKDVNPAELKIKVKHSDGTLAEITPTIVTDKQGNTYLEFTVNKFSTFIVYKPAEEEVVKETKTKIELTIGNTTVLVDGKEIKLKAAPFIKEITNRTLVPVRFISETLGAKVEWNSELREVYITNNGKEITLKIDSDIVVVDNVNTKIDSPAEIVDERTYVPLRFVSETLGAEVKYLPATNKIVITK